MAGLFPISQEGFERRDSEYKGDASFDNVIERAMYNKGSDLKEYKAGFVELVEKAKELYTD